MSWLRAEVEVGLLAPIKAFPKGRIRGLVCLSSASAPSAGLQIYIPGGDEDRGIVAQNCHTEVMTTPVQSMQFGLRFQLDHDLASEAPVEVDDRLPTVPIESIFLHVLLEVDTTALTNFLNEAGEPRVKLPFDAEFQFQLCP